jgi:thioredoxin-like negative regulator of GroEL
MAAEAIPMVSLDSNAKIQLKELAFGELLYDYYQENYFSALTRLDVAEYKNEIVEHKYHIQLLRGVMYLSYGMLNSAEQIFTQLLSQQSQDEKLAQVRFYLAKTHYLNGQFEQAEIHLQRAESYLPLSLKDEALLIRSQMAFERGDFEQPHQLLQKISAESVHGQFAQFNLAVFLLQKGQLEDAISLFERLYPNQKSDDVERSLYDRANLALGYYFLQQKDFEQARNHLLNVRLNSVFSNRALLSLGWAYYEHDVEDKAIGYWQELTRGDARDPAVQEAAMALAFAYYKRGAKKEALEAFVNAAAMYGQQLTLIESAKEDLKQNLFQRWLDTRGLFGDKIFDRWAAGDVPVTGHAIEYYLQDVVATNEFNQHFQRFQEMSHLNRVLERWKRQLPVYEEMLSNHRQRYQKIHPQVVEKTQSLLSEDFAAQVNQLAQEANSRLERNDLWVLANAEELEYYNDLMRIKSIMDNIPPERIDLEEQREQWRRIYGALMWKLAAQYGPKKYHLETQVKEAQQAIEALRQQSSSMATADSKASTRFLNYDQRITSLTARIESLQQSVEANRHLARQAMEQVLLEKLNKRKQEIDFLLAQTELSIAKIQDEAIGRLLETRQ